MEFQYYSVLICKVKFVLCIVAGDACPAGYVREGKRCSYDLQCTSGARICKLGRCCVLKFSG